MQLKIKEFVALSQEIATGIGRGYVLTECDKNDIMFAMINLCPNTNVKDTGETPYLQIPDLASVSDVSIRPTQSTATLMQRISREKI